MSLIKKIIFLYFLITNDCLNHFLIIFIIIRSSRFLPLIYTGSTPLTLTEKSKKFKEALLETTLTVALNIELDGGGSETVTDKVFLASNTEVGYENQNNIVEGRLFPIFSDFSSRIAYITVEGLADSDYDRKPADDVTFWQWLLRTPTTGSSSATRVVDSSNGFGSFHAYSGYSGVRPLCNLSSSVFVSDNPDENGIYTITFYPSGYVNAEGLEIALTKTKKYVDERSIKVLEASTDNVIDFNTLTETGIYLIKNCSDSAGTTLNSGHTSDNVTTDIILEVFNHTSNGNKLL